MDDTEDSATIPSARSARPSVRGESRVPGPPEALYGLGVIGGWAWFWQAADGFGEHVWALVQGVFWPAYLVYDALRALHA